MIAEQIRANPFLESIQNQSMSGLENSVPLKKRELPNLSPREDGIVRGLDSAAAEERDSAEQREGDRRLCIVRNPILPSGGLAYAGAAERVLALVALESNRNASCIAQKRGSYE